MDGTGRDGTGRDGTGRDGTHWPGSHRQAEGHTGVFSFFPPPPPSFCGASLIFLSREVGRSFPSATVKSNFVYPRHNRSPLVGHDVRRNLEEIWKKSGRNPSNTIDSINTINTINTINSVKRVEYYSCTCPLHTNSGCGKERRILIGPW